MRVHREPVFWLLLLLAVAIYLPRLSALTIRGEESRRAVIAREMLDHGDWIVPRIQGEVRFSRPPLQNWMIAGLALLSGEMDAWAIRLPGAIATVLTVALVYWAARRTLSVTGAVVAAAAYVSFFHILELGGTGETEPLFTLFVAASLLLWHGLQHDTSPTRKQGDLQTIEGSPRLRVGLMTAWTIGGACAGLGLLTKGIQAPMYFFGSVWIYLLATRQVRAIFHPSHLAGLASFAAVVALWQLPFLLEMGLEGSVKMYFWNVGYRFKDDHGLPYIVHFLSYPPSVLVACISPWSVLLLAFLNRSVRERLGPRREQAVFLLTCILICLPSVWLPPGSRPRYFMPLFPCFAVLVGMAGEMLLEHAGERVGQIWTQFSRLSGWFFGLTALALPLMSLFWPSSENVVPLWQAVATGIALLVVAEMIRRAQTVAPDIGMQRAALAIAAGLGIIHLGPVLTTQQQRSENLPAAIARLQSELPSDVELVSFDVVHHVFLYYYGRDVKRLAWPQSTIEVPANVDYFCVQSVGRKAPELPFAWDEIAALPVDRNHHDPPRECVIVGRRRDVTSSDIVQAGHAEPQ